LIDERCGGAAHVWKRWGLSSKFTLSDSLWAGKTGESVKPDFMRISVLHGVIATWVALTGGVRDQLSVAFGLESVITLGRQESELI
jgi:hypothetical protein